MNSIQRLIREPLVHFLAIGLAVFGFYAALAKPTTDASENRQIVVTQQKVEQLVTQFRQTWRRKPSREELDKILEVYVREDVLVREALALSMDKGDPVIRRRLVQKMIFLTESTASAQSFKEADLLAFYQENSQDYTSAPKLALEHVFLGETPSNKSVSDSLDALRSGSDLSTLGQRSLLNSVIPLSAAQSVDGTFGRGFFDEIMSLEDNVWIAPVKSGFGWHAVRITQRLPGTLAPYDSIRQRVEDDLRAAKSSEIAEAVIAKIRIGYQVVLPTVDQLTEVLQ